MAVDTNTRSPQTIGLETAMPATAVFHATFSPVLMFHFTAVAAPSATPAAFVPRNAGQCCAVSEVPATTQARTVKAFRRIITFPPLSRKQRDFLRVERERTPSPYLLRS